MATGTGDGIGGRPVPGPGESGRAAGRSHAGPPEPPARGSRERVPGRRPGEEAAVGRRTILVVEDDEDVRLLVVAVLEGRGYRVLAAPDGWHALELLHRDKTIDLLFTDLVMPGGLSGTELAHKARGLRPGLKVLLTSGYVGHRMLAVRPMDDNEAFLAKPYRPAALIHRIRALLGA